MEQDLGSKLGAILGSAMTLVQNKLDKLLYCTVLYSATRLDSTHLVTQFGSELRAATCNKIGLRTVLGVTIGTDLGTSIPQFRTSKITWKTTRIRTRKWYLEDSRVPNKRHYFPSSLPLMFCRYYIFFLTNFHLF